MHCCINGNGHMTKMSFYHILSSRLSLTWFVHNLISWRCHIKWTASSEFGTYRLCEQRRFRRACASEQSRLNLRCSLIQAVSQEEPSDRKPDPWSLWMAGHVQLKFVVTECSKTQIRLTGPKFCFNPAKGFRGDVWKQTIFPYKMHLYL